MPKRIRIISFILLASVICGCGKKQDTRAMDTFLKYYGSYSLVDVYWEEAETAPVLDLNDDGNSGTLLEELQVLNGQGLNGFKAKFSGIETKLPDPPYTCSLSAMYPHINDADDEPYRTPAVSEYGIGISGHISVGGDIVFNDNPYIISFDAETALISVPYNAYDYLSSSMISARAVFKYVR